MLQFLSSRESGLVDPLKLRRAETTRRAFSLELSRHKDAEGLHTGSVNSLDIDLVENRYLLSGGAHGNIGIHDLQNTTASVKHTCPTVAHIGVNNRHRHKFSVETVLWYPADTGLFTSSGTDKLLKVWDTNRLKPADQYEFSGIVYNHDMSSVATKHCLLAVGTTSSSVKLVDLKSGSATHTLRGHRAGVMAVRWSPHNEFLLATGGADSKILLWDIRNAKGSLLVFDQLNGKKVRKTAGHTGVTSHTGSVNGLQFTTDGLHIVSVGTDNLARLWDTATGRNVKVHNLVNVSNNGKRTLQFSISSYCSPDLLFMPRNGAIEVFHLYTGVHFDTLYGHYMLVNCCKYHQDYQELYSGGTDRKILMWLPNGNSDYEDAPKVKRKQESVTDIVQTPDIATRPAVTADSWSSDEDT